MSLSSRTRVSGVQSADSAPTTLPQMSDIPPDMAILLRQLDDDFSNKKIDQWNYINRREELLQLIQKMLQQRNLAGPQTKGPLAPVIELEEPLLPREPSSAPIADFGQILACRASVYKQEQAVLTLDVRGKENLSILWEKLYLKALKVAYEMKHKGLLKRGDTVLLLYKEHEVPEFMAALFACFMNEVTAVPIHNDILFSEVLEINKLTLSKLVLMSDTVFKDIEKLINLQKFQWPSKLMRWRTLDMGLAKKAEVALWQRERKNSKLPATQLAYVEFSRLPVGELRGIAVSHRTIQHQMLLLLSTLASMPGSGTLVRPIKEMARARRVFLATMDTRVAIGLILGVMFTVYTGNVLIWAPQKVMEIQGLYANLILRTRALLLLADYLGLKRVTYDYQTLPNSTRYFLKTQRVDFSSVKWVLVNALIVDGEFMEVLLQRYLKPLGCQDPESAPIPMLTLSEYGGMVILMRDWLPSHNSASGSELLAVLLDKEALSHNMVRIVDTNPADEPSHDTLRVDAFGFPIPDATVAVVNPETLVLVAKGELGEIWVDSPCLSGGFFALRNELKLIFHAKCRDNDGVLEMDFLRTGLLGFSYKGKVYILGLYEDRIRQRVLWMDQQIFHKLGKQLTIGNGIRYHYSSHLLATLANQVRQIYDCTIFDVFLGNEYLPVAIVEAEVIRRVEELEENGSINASASDNAGGSGGGRSGASGGGNEGITYAPVPLNEPVLNSIAQRCFDVLYKHHFLRLYCVLVVDIDSLPKIIRSGGKEIANMLCKKRYLDGSLRGEYVKFFVRKSISMIPHGEDMLGGIWLPYLSELRAATLQGFPPQMLTIDLRDKTIDDRTGAPLLDFKTILDVLKFRVAQQGDQVAIQNLDSSAKSKQLTWRKFEQRVYAVCLYLIDKILIKPGLHVMLMYLLGEEFLIACFACFMCGIVAVPILPFDLNRIGEDFPAFAGTVKDFNVTEILINEEVEKFIKSSGPVADLIKKLNQRRLHSRPHALPPLRFKNTLKLTKFNSLLALLNLKILKYQAAVNFRDPLYKALVWLSFTSDHYRVAAYLSHKNIMGICKVFKETCGMLLKLSLVGCVRHSLGIGFIQAVILGVYLGSTTYLCLPVLYAENPLAFFLLLARYKVKDVFVTEQMLKYAVIKFQPKGFDLSCIKNMMISSEERVEPDLMRKLGQVFAPAKLSVAAMSTVYYHNFNPMVATRLYMTVAPVGLYLDPIALRQGYVSVANPAETPHALYIQDLGMVPVCTQIAIVNPETCEVCPEGQFGEIWVHSESNVAQFSNGPKGPVDKVTDNQFNGRLLGGSSNDDRQWLRTGDLGFLHHILISKTQSNEGAESLFQPLFVLGRIADTFELLGLHHFPIDIENTIESCHRDVYKNGLCVFKCSDYTIVVCESRRHRHLASLVPLIANTVFSKHHLMVDIVAFMSRGQFPILRLGTKQRARIVDAWVQGVLPVVATYGVNNGEKAVLKTIKDIDATSRDDPVTGMRNPALLYYDDEDVFLGEAGLTLNWDRQSMPLEVSEQRNPFSDNQ